MSYRQHFTEQELQVLEERAKRVSHLVDHLQDEAYEPLVYVWVEQEVYAMPMHHLTSVYQDVAVVPVPCTPAFIAGVANIRGRVMSVIDLARLLNVSPALQQENKMLVVVGGEVIFRVNRIGEGSAGGSLRALPETLNIPHPEFIAGILSDGTAQLNVPAILNSPVINQGAGQ